MTWLRFLLAPLLAFFDFRVYGEGLRSGIGRAFAFLGYLTLLSLMIAFFQIQKVNDFLDWLPQHVPALTLTQNGMKLNEPGFKSIQHPTLGPIAAFDDGLTTIQPDQMQSFRFFMTSKMIYWRANLGDPIQSGEIGSRAKEPFEAKIDGQAIEKLIDRFYGPLAFLVLVIFGLMLFVQKLLVAAFFSLVGLAAQAFMTQKLSYKSIFILSCYALAIEVVFSILQFIPGFAPFASGLVGSVLAAVYLVIALVLHAKSNEK